MILPAALSVSLVVLLATPSVAGKKKPNPPPPTSTPEPAMGIDCAGALDGADTDQDGLSDQKECQGLSVLDGDAFDFSSVCTAPTDPDCGGAAPQALGLDPTVKDVFIEVVLDSPSGYDELGVVLETDVFQVIENELNVHVHRVGVDTPAPTDVCQVQVERCLTPPPTGATQEPRWLRLTENRSFGVNCSLIPPTPPYGTAQVGSDAEYGLATAFSGRIIDHIGCILSANGDTTTDPTPIQKQQLVTTTIHELNHLWKNLNGSHAVTGSGCIMDASSTYSVGGKKNAPKVSFAIPTTHCAASRDAVAAGSNTLGALFCGDAVAGSSSPLSLDGDPVDGCLP
jgi:hypothetical protein